MNRRMSRRRRERERERERGKLGLRSKSKIVNRVIVLIVLSTSLSGEKTKWWVPTVDLINMVNNSVMHLSWYTVPSTLALD